jgi:hypothetical protein
MKEKIFLLTKFTLRNITRCSADGGGRNIGDKDQFFYFVVSEPKRLLVEYY